MQINSKQSKKNKVRIKNNMQKNINLKRGSYETKITKVTTKLLAVILSIKIKDIYRRFNIPLILIVIPIDIQNLLPTCLDLRKVPAVKTRCTRGNESVSTCRKSVSFTKAFPQRGLTREWKSW